MRQSRRAGRRSSSTQTATANETPMSRPISPLDPAKDKRIMAAFYGVQPSPVDDSIWGQSMDIGFSGIDQPGTSFGSSPGPNPSETALAEIYVPPEEGYGPRGLDLDLNGVVWTALSSGHLGASTAPSVSNRSTARMR